MSKYMSGCYFFLTFFKSIDITSNSFFGNLFILENHWAPTIVKHDSLCSRLPVNWQLDPETWSDSGLIDWLIDWLLPFFFGGGEGRKDFIGSQYYSFFINFFSIYLFIFRETERVQTEEVQGERERERERIPSRLCRVSTELNVNTIILKEKNILQ